MMKGERLLNVVIRQKYGLLPGFAGQEESLPHPNLGLCTLYSVMDSDPSSIVFLTGAYANLHLGNCSTAAGG